jgi:hypothetical protein
MNKLLRGHRLLIALPLLLIMLLIVPALTMGLTWVRDVGLLSADAVVFASNAPAMDRFMAAAMRNVYGARVQVCDGTADQVEIQAAVDGLSAGRTARETVRIVGGDFTIAAPVVAADYTRLDCTGSRLTLANNADCVMLDFTDTYDCEITGAKLKGNKANCSAGTGMDISDCEIMRINNAYVLEFDDYGIKMNNATGDTQSQLWITNSNVSECGSWGIYLYGNGTPQWSSDFWITDCKVTTNYGGIYLYKMQYGHVLNCNVTDSSTSSGLYIRDSGSTTVHGGVYRGSNGTYGGIWVANSQKIVVDGVFFEANVTAGGDEREIHVDGTSYDVTITGCNFDPDTTATGYVKAIYIATGAKRVSIVGNEVADFGNVTGATDVKAIYLAPPVSDNVFCSNNLGWIAPAELRTYAVTITAGTENATTYFQNPFAQAVYIYETRVAITTAASATAPTYDLKIDTDGAGVPDGTALHDAIPDTVGSYWSWSGAYGTDATGVQTGLVTLASNAGTSDWLGFCIEDAAGADTAGVIYITLMGQ